MLTSNEPVGSDVFGDDFHHLDLAATWEPVGDTEDGASVVLADDGDSGIVLSTGTTNNNAIYLQSQRAFQIAPNQTLNAELLLRFPEAGSDTASVLFGLIDAIATDPLADDSHGFAGAYAGVALTKQRDGGYWLASAASGGPNVTTTTERRGQPAMVEQLLRISIGRDAVSDGTARFEIGQEGGSFARPCHDADHLPIVHTVLGDAFGPLRLVFGVKAGSNVNQSIRVLSTSCSL